MLLFFSSVRRAPVPGPTFVLMRAALRTFAFSAFTCLMAVMSFTFTFRFWVSLSAREAH
ncbi:MAG: hypothetical protein JWN15_3779 [Firmicutes bacterium]|nr:hypothetical protein [Bacillota bacterium]